MASSSAKSKSSAAKSKQQPISSLSSHSDLTAHFSKKQVWKEMPHHRASSARVDDDDDDDVARDSPASHQSSSLTATSLPRTPAQLTRPTPTPISHPLLQSTLSAILSPPRLSALEACDVAPIPYRPHDFFSHMLTLHGRNFPMIASPLLFLFLWGLSWQVLFTLSFPSSSKYGASYGQTLGHDPADAQIAIAALDALVLPLSIPLSFLLTFRLDRSAVRFWDARQACGKMTEVCRATVATAWTGVLAPIRRRRRREREATPETTTSIETTAGAATTIETTAATAAAAATTTTTETAATTTTTTAEANVEAEAVTTSTAIPTTDTTTATIPTTNATTTLSTPTQTNDEKALALLCEYAKWLTVFPIAVEHFLRPHKRTGWDDETFRKKRRFHIGRLLSDHDARRVLMECDDADGNPAWYDEQQAGLRTRDPPLVVLHRLRELAWDLSYFDYRDAGTAPHPQAQAALCRQLNGQLDVLYGAYGTMERIKSLPLPFVYATHLRTFLLLYLVLWNMTSVAHFGWIALPCLFVANWSLLGIEAASVECERPFDWNRNHLTLGKFAVGIARNVGQTLREVRW